MTDRLDEYRLLIAKVDAKIAEVTAHQAAQLACAKGCHTCCAPGLSVAAVEAAAIADYLDAHTEQHARAHDLARDQPWGAARCQFLDRGGACVIYPVRPLVCRTQGLPIVLEDGALTACALNFGKGFNVLPATDRIDQRTLSTLLFVVNERFGGGERRPLTVDGVALGASR